MSRVQKAGEPSMDEILSSIRKIISEDSGGPKPAAPPPPPRLGAATRADPFGLNTSPPTANAAPLPTKPVSEQLKTDIDDILGLADGLAEPRPEAPAAPAPTAASAAGEEVPAWLFPKGNAGADDVPSPAGAAKPAAPNGAPKPFFPNSLRTGAAKAPSPSVAPNGDNRPNGTGHHEPSDQPTDSGSSASLNRDLGAFVPQRDGDAADHSGRPGPKPAATPTSTIRDRRIPDRRLPARAAQDDESDRAPQPVAAPQEPTRFAAKDAGLAVTDTSSLAAAAAGTTGAPGASEHSGLKAPEAGTAAAALPADAAAAPIAPAATSPKQSGLQDLLAAKSDPDKSATTAGMAAQSSRAVDAGAPADQMRDTLNAKPSPAQSTGALPIGSDGTTTASQAASAHEAGAAAPAEGTNRSPAEKPAASAPAPEVVAAPDRPDPGSASAKSNGGEATENASGTALAVAQPEVPVSVPKPVPLAERLRAPRPAASDELVPTVAEASAVRTLEDTVVDLLRPMIRQWLDDNMPRMVEKALRVEMAEQFRSKDGQSKH